MKNPKEKYGKVGWREFFENRKKILNAFDQAKSLNSHRPIQTSHGVVVEEAIRIWLTEFLPGKYGVTSGYVIPDIVSMEYKLYHYDIIIYNKLDSPILWTESDTSGKAQAIPAKFVYHIIEVKSTFDGKNIREGLKKIKSLDEFQEFLPNHFKSSLIFVDMKNGVLNKQNILRKFYGNLPVSYNETLVLRSQLNEDMSATLHLQKLQGGEEKITPLAKNIDEIKMNKTEFGFTLEAGGTSLELSKDEKNPEKIHVIKGYSSTVHEKELMISLNWSFNAFSAFSFRLLNTLHPHNPINYGSAEFGKIYNVIKFKEE